MHQGIFIILICENPEELKINIFKKKASVMLAQQAYFSILIFQN